MKALNIQNKLTILDQQSLAKYLNELSSDKATVPLSPEQEYALFVEYKLNGSKEIKERLIKANLRWVVTIAKQYSYPKARTEDIISEGNIGMIKAIDRFDPTRGFSFLSYATSYIRQAIKMYIDEVLIDIAQPANRFRINRLIAKAERTLQMLGEEHPTTEQLIEEYMRTKESTDPRLTAADLNEIKKQTQGFISMETQLSDVDKEEMTLAGTFKSGSEYNADYEIAKNDKNYEINKMLNSLPGREKAIVEYTFGLNGCEEKTLEQIADVIGLTRERVGQLLQVAIEKLKGQKGKVYELCGSAKETAHSIESNHWSFAGRGN